MALGLENIFGGIDLGLGTGRIEGLLSQGVTVILQILSAVLVLAVFVGIIWYILREKKYNIKTIIFSKRKGNDKVIEDKGGYFKGKDGIWSFKIKKMKIALQPPEYNYLMPTAKGNALFLRQEGINEFYPLMPDISIESGLKLKVIEGDVALWGVTMMGKIREAYAKPGFFQKYGSYIIFGIVAVMCIVLIYIIVQKFDVLQSVAQSLENTARILKETSIAMESTAPQ